MTSFTDFLTSIYASGNDGKAFELFAKWFLQNDPEWKTQVDEVWLWDEWPDRWGKDKGIDLVFRHRNGEFWAVQAKCYSPNYYVTKSDIDSFLSESNRSIIKRRLLMATTDKLGANAIEVCEGQDKAVTRFMLHNFEQANVEYPASIDQLHKVKKKKKPEPRDHQKAAIKDVVKGFKSVDRGQLIMACGTGKTFTTLWIKERMKAKLTLVLLPSLNLLSQTVSEWSFASQSKIDVLCVCSDKSVGKRKNEDEVIQSASAVPFPVHSDPEEIKRFMQGDGDRVVFSTYQSSALIADAQKGRAIEFDLVIADEAHRCAVSGKKDSYFSLVLNNQKIKAKKRLFATATPRTFTSRLKKAAEERGVEVIGMDDEQAFGKPMHTLSFSDAIKNDPPLLTDYQVVIVGVDNTMIKEWIEERELVTTEHGNQTTDAAYLAAQIGLLKAIKNYGLKRVISFHSFVDRAEMFSNDIHEAAKIIKKAHRPSGMLNADYVSGKMSTSDRGDKLKRLKEIGDDEIGLLSNARCLSEGVDVPSLDGVAFIDPKNSQVDIIQAVGRAIRLSDGKEKGTIVLPVFIEDGDDAVERIDASNFRPVWWVLDALKAHDDELVDELDALRTELGKKHISGNGRQKFSCIEIDLPTSVGEGFAAALRTRLVEQTTSSWSYYFGQLISYRARHGDTFVPHLSDDYSELGSWVAHQRRLFKQGIITQERVEKLEALGFVWNVIDELWEKKFNALKQFHADNGHSMVPSRYPEDQTLAKWCDQQRTRKRSNMILKAQADKLESIGFVWDQREAKWREMYDRMIDYVYKNGTSIIDGEDETVSDLSGWCRGQRTALSKGSLSSSRKNLLDTIGFIWDLRDHNWTVMYDQLAATQDALGKCVVPTHIENKDLANWCQNQRDAFKANALSSDRIGLLSRIGFSFDPRADAWNAQYGALIEYKNKRGDCDVRQSDREYKQLGRWVQKQRANYKNNKLSAELISKLNRIGFIWSSKSSND